MFSAVKILMKWFFALDHNNYTRWLSVHLYDLLRNETDVSDVYKHFKKGNFSFKSGDSNVALDEVHEQNNAILKSVGGVAHLLNKQDESALLHWELCSRDLAI